MIKVKYCTIVIILLIIILFLFFHQFNNKKESFDNKADISNLSSKITGLVNNVGSLTDILKNSKKEGFYSEGDLAVSNFSYAKGSPLDISHWEQPNLNCNGSGTKALNNRKPQPIPLPKDELLMFANTPFKPECCPNTYSNSTGCACMTVPQYKYLINRGGNNIPYSEY